MIILDLDDHSRFTYIYLIRTKDQAFDMFKNYKVLVENQLEKRLKSYVVIEEVNTFQMNFLFFVNKIVQFIKQVLLIPHNKMV